MSIKAYCMRWHLGGSDAFHDLIVDALKGRLNIELADIDEWSYSRDPQIFCQIPIPKKVLDNPSTHPIWIPMWDNVWDYPQEWWDNMPKHVRIICFSETLHRRVAQAGLQTILMKYYKDPSKFTSAEWVNGRVIFYWNRTGLYSPKFIEKLCKNLCAEKLIFRADIDHGIPKNHYFELPDQIGDTRVETILPTKDRSNSYKKMSEANIYLAPREREGVGMTFIEALARGMGVIAYDEPTMNEYISHMETGYLVSGRLPSSSRTIRGLAKIRKKIISPNEIYLISGKQSWNEIAKVEWEALGNKAAVLHKEGYDNWQTQLDKYATFIGR